MPRKKTQTVITTVKLTPEVRVLWEQCAEHEQRTMTNLLEVMLRANADRLGVKLDSDRVAVLVASIADKQTPGLAP